MRLKPTHWASHLRGPLASVYGLFSDEPLLLQEAEDALMAAAAQHGFAQKQRLAQQDGGIWDALRDERDAGSLFAAQRVLLLRLDSPKVPKEGSAALQYWLASPPPDALLVVSGPRPDASTQKTAWFKGIETHGHTLLLYRPEGRDWSRWVEERLRAAGMQADSAAVQLLTDLSAGNLGACHQAIQRLQQVYPGQRIDVIAIRAVLADSSQFTIYDLADAVLRGETEQMLHMLDRLRNGDGEPALCLWVLHKDLRLLAELRAGGVDVDAFFRQNRIFPPRQGWLRTAARRLTRSGLQAGIEDCLAIDARIKGQDPTPVWPALTDLCLRMCR
ncbi:DNA polymerase III subunit delta [Acidithiobacillus sp. 'AMD consortium']|uniref:DNA polymerase III subunit delta n=2 Tax=Acidithiobacillus ferridurans TaxID=1232575 RepID=A0A2Z6ILL7_ACIFI|nr:MULTISPECIES: DNA polymerase III subunit delta [Acidithiobacillus]MBU2722704.1 DNA polymerase III subunit delta [Acidithiobacillus ferridurans]MBU2728257.1 DNA polymerase III subunit delta [Acidithiobacillus ferridurans]QFG77649.1 DNA polymerase III subunit delta [Acidithiobacillus sp. 'AMD consortium']BBF65474.1 DNA polymerase III subunit delta [Acidithiobacillus ferridurans]